MASAFSHIAVPIALRLAVGAKKISLRLLLLALFLSVAPDLDSVAFRFGIPYESPWGHRGFTHSIFFAGMVSWGLSFFAGLFRSHRKVIFVVSFASMISHGFLDGFTDGGLGVAYFWPFDTQRYFFPWQVIEVSPISVARFFTQRGVSVLASEAYYIWLPCLVVGVSALSIRKIFFRKRTSSESLAKMDKHPLKD